MSSSAGATECECSFFSLRAPRISIYCAEMLRMQCEVGTATPSMAIESEWSSHVLLRRAVGVQAGGHPAALDVLDTALKATNCLFLACPPLAPGR